MHRLYPNADPGLQQTGAVVQAGHGSSFLIQGGQFVQNNQASGGHNCYDADDGFKHLQAHVAPAAYASQQDGDAPKCHPNTCQAVLDDIMNWVILAATRIQWILWLNRAAGAGKSAIARSIVDLCSKRRIMVARFFFFRTDTGRNTLNPVVATLAYQLIKLIPDLDSIISAKIRSDPLIFKESLETQFEQLIFEPLCQLHLESPFLQPLLLLFDGVDECTGPENQTRLIRTIVQFIETKAIPLIVLFSSREEVQIKAVFQSAQVSLITRQLPLDDHYLPDEDIRLFLNDSFTSIKNSHPFKRLFDPDWPAPALVKEIVDKSSGQFIYASVVMQFGSTPRLHSAQQLEIARGLRLSCSSVPFAQLDCLYRHILSQVTDIKSVTSILAFHILSNTGFLLRFTELLGIPSADIPILMADLTSVMECQENSIEFLHASLPDFLLDKTRSQEYHISRTDWCTQFAVMLLRKAAKSGQTLRYFFILSYLPYVECTADLRESILAFNANSLTNLISCNDWTLYLTAIQNLDFGDDGQVYHQQVELFSKLVNQETGIYHLENSRQEILEFVEWEIERQARQETEHQASEKMAVKKAKLPFGTRLKSMLKSLSPKK